MKSTKIEVQVHTSGISKLNWCLRGVLLVSAVVLLIYLFATKNYQVGQFDYEIETSEELSDRPPYTAYGKGCQENPYRERFKILLKSWEGIAARQNITDYFICFGSMLGQARNGDCVPYDHDVDICMFRRDLYKLDPEEEKRPFKYDDGTPHLIIQRQCHHPPSNTPRHDCAGNVVYHYTDKCAILDPCARILLGSPPFLDVFAFKDNGKDLLDQYKLVTHKREDILPFKPCKFLGIQTKCPNNEDAYLTKYYGQNYYDKPVCICKGGKWVAPS